MKKLILVLVALIGLIGSVNAETQKIQWRQQIPGTSGFSSKDYEMKTYYVYVDDVQGESFNSCQECEKFMSLCEYELFTETVLLKDELRMIQELFGEKLPDTIAYLVTLEYNDQTLTILFHGYPDGHGLSYKAWRK